MNHIREAKLSDSDEISRLSLGLGYKSASQEVSN